MLLNFNKRNFSVLRFCLFWHDRSLIVCLFTNDFYSFIFYSIINKYIEFLLFVFRWTWHSHEKMKKMSNTIDDAIVQIDQNADSQACIILSLIRSIDKINTRKSKNVKQNIAYLKHLRIKSRTFGLIFSRFDLFLLVITKINL